MFRSTTLATLLLSGFLATWLAPHSVAGPIDRVGRIDSNLVVAERVVIVRRVSVRPAYRVVSIARRPVVSRARTTVIVRPRRVVSSPAVTVF